MRRGAASIALSDGGAGATSGRHVTALRERFGIPMNRRRPFPRGLTAVQAVARGEMSVVITQASEILAEPGAVLVAPLPDGVQLITRYVAAIPPSERDATGAREFIAFAPWSGCGHVQGGRLRGRIGP